MKKMDEVKQAVLVARLVQVARIRARDELATTFCKRLARHTQTRQRGVVAPTVFFRSSNQICDPVALRRSRSASRGYPVGDIS